MLRLQFKDFQDKIKQDKLVNHYATLHCMQMPDGIMFIVKSREKWDYYSIVKFEEILKYAQEQDMEPNEAMDMFLNNYCSDAIMILPDEIESTEILEEPESQEEPKPEEIEKRTITKPQQVEECVNSLLADPDFEAYEGQTREETAYAICYARYNKSCSCQSNPSTFSPPPQQAKKQNNDVIDSGEDIIENAEDYSDFLLKFFDNMEKNVIKATEQLKDELEKQYTTKTFSEFLRNLFNKVNIVAFAKQVRKYIKGDLVAGLVSAESELNMDIGFTETFQDKLNQLASQQIDGYTINGKKWPGIKGVTKEIQSEIIRTVQQGVNDKQSLDEIRDEIKDKFSNFSEWRSEMIARTETNRMNNEGKLTGYKESGMDGVKVWSAAVDDRTSPICTRLNGQEVGLDEEFVDPETNKRYMTPPSHPHCRSTIFFKPN